MNPLENVAVFIYNMLLKGLSHWIMSAKCIYKWTHANPGFPKTYSQLFHNSLIDAFNKWNEISTVAQN